MKVRRHMKALRRHNLRNADGQTMTEYAFVLVLIVAVVMAMLPFFGTQVLHLWSEFVDSFGGGA
jgi:Flp pilus assembly pilin Flp